MNNKSILASPNWYNSTVCDVSTDGVLAFGGKNTIFLHALTKPECCLLSQLCGHKDRVTSVRFCKAAGYSRLCVSGSEDHTVVIWDIDSNESVSKHNKHEGKVTAVSWSSVSPDWIISGDENGYILSWNRHLNLVYQHRPMNGHIFCLLCSPVEEGLVVVGYKTGQILVLVLRNEKHEVVRQLKGHNDEVHSLVWSPVLAAELPNELFGVPQKQENTHILASGSRDKTMRLWDISSGQFIAVVSIPTRTAARKGMRNEQNMKQRLWLTLCWLEADPTCLFSSGYSGDVLMWDLSKSSKQKWQLFGNGSASRHNRIVFNICQYAPRSIVVTVSMDRLVNIWDQHEAKILCSLPSLGGFVYSMDLSYIDPTVVALGVGDNMIRVWDTLPTKQICDVKSLWRGINAKVMKVLWHPVKEGVLGFGTEEGKVGIYSVMSQTCSSSRTYHKKAVYSLSWGPPSGSKDDPSSDVELWHLYSCGGEGMVLEHNPARLNDLAKNLDTLVKATNNIKHNLAGHSEISWKQDRCVVAIGNEDGSIQLYRAHDLKMLLTISVHNKSITCLAWYCGHKEEDLSNSSFLASSSNGFDIHVHDLKSNIEAYGEQHEKLMITNSFQRLVGHSGRVTNIVWSPHTTFRLVSSSYDGTVQVWDVLKGEGLANYRGHNGRVMSVTWSLTDHDIIYSGGEDFTVRSWRVSEQLFKTPPIDGRLPKSKSKKTKKKVSVVSQNNEHAQETPCTKFQALDFEEKTFESNTNNDLVGQELEITTNQENETGETSLQFLTTLTEKSRPNAFNSVSLKNEPTPNLIGEAKKKKKKGKSLFPLSASADNKSRTVTSKECVKIAKYVYKNEEMKEMPSLRDLSINLGLFTSRDAAFNMLTKEGEQHLQSGNVDYQLQLEVWKGNIVAALQMAVEKRQLSDWLVSLSHLAGEHVRLAVTEAFAEQLASQGSYHRAALYYLGCHKVYDAIHMFHKSGMYREAVALAKVRLLPSDPVLVDIYSSWARKLENECAFEQAAKCYLACGLCDDAVRVLTRRDDEIDLVAAAEVAYLTGRQDQAESLILGCALSAIRSARWADALDMVHNYSNMQVILMLLHTHKALVVFLKQLEIISSENFPDMQEVNSYHDHNILSKLPRVVLELKAHHERRKNSEHETHWEPARNAVDSYILVNILENWCAHSQLDLTGKHLHGLYAQISALNFVQTLAMKSGIEQILMTVSKDVCLGLVAALVGKLDICLQHFLQAIVKCHDCGYPGLLQTVFVILFPFGLQSWYMITELTLSPLPNPEAKIINSSFQNILAFYYRELLDIALLDWDIKTELPLKDSVVNTSDEIGDKKKEKLVPVSSGVKVVDGNAELAPANILCENVYKIALLSSTVLLSETYVQLQNNCKKFQFSNANRTTEINQTSEDHQRPLKTNKGSQNVQSLSLPFPDVIETARNIVSLCFKVLRTKPNVGKHGFFILAQQVISWAVYHVRDGGDDKVFFGAALQELTALQ